jgi:type III pantothenate kinase
MDINLLTLNVGNSRLAIGVFSAGELSYIKRIPHASRGEWEAEILAAWERISNLDRPAIAAASVNPPLDQPLNDLIRKITSQAIQWAGRDLDIPVGVETQEPNKTGVDRILNLAAAYEQMGKACCVVDAGTAITVDCCNDNGDFLGGAISPGLNMLLDALHDKTASLPRVQFEIPKDTFGKSTASAICNGVYHSIRGMVRELVERYATDLGVWPDVIATGGDAEKLFAGWEVIHAVSPDLTLYGIALAFTEHHLRHDT